MIYIKQANSESFAVGPIKDCAGQPVDLLAAEVRMIVKENINDEDSAAVLSKSVIHPESNIVLFNFTPEEMSDLMVGQYVMAFKIFWDNGDEIEIFNDTLVVEKGVFNE
jgi:hypothetical protein